MKRNILFVTMLALLLVAGGRTMGQQAKFGHVDIATVMQATPEWGAAETELQQFGENLTKEGEALQAELQKKYEEYQQKQATYSEAVAKLKQQELQDMVQRLEKFKNDAAQSIEEKQEQLLTPIRLKVLDAIKGGEKERGDRVARENQDIAG